MNNTTTAPTGYNPMLPLIGRILLSAIFLISGIRKLLMFVAAFGPGSASVEKS